EIIQDWGYNNGIYTHYKEYDVRQKNEVPDLSYDIYISTGGPGSPLDSVNTNWEKNYFNWIETLHNYNLNSHHTVKKQVFFICHSFQLACRYFDVATVCKRKSTAFGIFPIHMLDGAEHETIFQHLKDPFYAVDSRDYQVIEPNKDKIEALGGKILCIEKNRPHVPYERAVMAIRFNDWFIGTQFHPEADAIGMSMYLQRDDKKNTVIKEHGEAKWHSMVEHLRDPDKILHTYHKILPNFLTEAAPARFQLKA
ncbi:MAG: type 1 glutamine amidotransferase, partial [Chitinophagaceae bacterium]